MNGFIRVKCGSQTQYFKRDIIVSIKWKSTCPLACVVYLQNSDSHFLYFDKAEDKEKFMQEVGIYAK